jgi:hypothetical protein
MAARRSGKSFGESTKSIEDYRIKSAPPDENP